MSCRDNSFIHQEGAKSPTRFFPGEVWYKFTLDNPAYPDEYTGFLWEKPLNHIVEYRDILYELMPRENHWLIDEILREDEVMRKDDDDFYWAIDSMLLCHPELEEPVITNSILDPVMRNPDIDKDIKLALWRAKVNLDSHIRIYKEDYPDGI